MEDKYLSNEEIEAIVEVSEEGPGYRISMGLKDLARKLRLAPTTGLGKMLLKDEEKRGPIEPDIAKRMYEVLGEDSRVDFLKDYFDYEPIGDHLKNLGSEEEN